jgi:hypothetical protein
MAVAIEPITEALTRIAAAGSPLISARRLSPPLASGDSDRAPCPGRPPGW